MNKFVIRRNFVCLRVATHEGNLGRSCRRRVGVGHDKMHVLSCSQAEQLVNVILSS